LSALLIIRRWLYGASGRQPLKNESPEECTDAGILGLMMVVDLGKFMLSKTAEKFHR
jgi:hypothetical protein